MISSSDYNRIMREYEEQQRINRAQRDARVDQVYAKAPQIKALDESRGTLAMELVKKGEAADIAQSFEKLRQQKAQLLKEAGFAPDYMDINYVCPDCKDTGYVSDEAGEHKCHCLVKKEIKMLYAQSNIEKVLERENFDTLDESKYSDKEHMAKVVQYCKRFVDQFPNQKCDGILLTGNTGTGKTFLCNCIADAIMKKNHSVIYLTATELFDVMAGARVGKDEDLKELYDKMLDCQLLIIDDLGSELTNSMTNSNLFFLLNHRLQATLPTVISTNLNIETMRDVYTERVTSRVKSSYDIIPVKGEDIRLKFK